MDSVITYEQELSNTPNYEDSNLAAEIRSSQSEDPIASFLEKHGNEFTHNHNGELISYYQAVEECPALPALIKSLGEGALALTAALYTKEDLATVEKNEVEELGEDAQMSKQSDEPQLLITQERSPNNKEITGSEISFTEQKQEDTKVESVQEITKVSADNHEAAGGSASVQHNSLDLESIKEPKPTQSKSSDKTVAASRAMKQTQTSKKSSTEHSDLKDEESASKKNYQLVRQEVRETKAKNNPESSQSGEVPLSEATQAPSSKDKHQNLESEIESEQDGEGETLMRATTSPEEDVPLAPENEHSAFETDPVEDIQAAVEPPIPIEGEERPVVEIPEHTPELEITEPKVLKDIDNLLYEIGEKVELSYNRNEIENSEEIYPQSKSIAAAEEELEELFIKLFEKLEIEYSRVLSDSFKKIIIKKEPNFELEDDEESKNSLDRGTHETIKQLLATTNNIRKRMLSAWRVGKSALRLYRKQMSTI